MLLVPISIGVACIVEGTADSCAATLTLSRGWLLFSTFVCESAFALAPPASLVPLPPLLPLYITLPYDVS